MQKTAESGIRSECMLLQRKSEMLQEMMEKRRAKPEARLERESPQSPNKSITRP